MTSIRRTNLLSTQYDFLTGNYLLDARIIPFETMSGKQLSDHIQESIRDEQQWIKQTLPSQLFVTQKQFVSLNDYTDEAYLTTDRIFKVLDEQGSIMCIMEVLIDDEYDTVDSIAQAKKQADEYLAKLDFTNMPANSTILSPQSFQDEF